MSLSVSSAYVVRRLRARAHLYVYTHELALSTTCVHSPVHLIWADIWWWDTNRLIPTIVCPQAFAACIAIIQSRDGVPISLNTAATCVQALLGAARSLDAVNRAEEAESLLAKAHPTSLQIEEHLATITARDADPASKSGDETTVLPTAIESKYRALIFDLHVHRSRVADKLGLFALCGNNLAHAMSAASTMLCNDKKAGVDACLTLAEEVLELARTATKKHKDHARALQLYETALEAASNSFVSSEDSRLSWCLHRIYVGLVGAHLELGRHEDAARCWTHLESTSSLASQVSDTAHVAVHYLGVKVKLATQAFDEAHEESEKLVDDANATMDHCCNAVRFLVNRGRTSDAIDVIWKACERFRDFGLDPVVDLLRLFLTKGESFDEDAALTIAADARMAVLSESAGDGVLSPDAKRLRQNVFTLLWNHGCAHFDAKEWSKTTTFFAAALSFAPLLDKAKVTRALALAHLGKKDTVAGKQYALLAEELDPSSVRTAMLVFQVQLQSGAHIDDISEQLEKIVMCDDFETDVLNIASSEALKVGRTDSAEKALFMLFTSITKAADSSPKSPMPTPGREANVIRNAIMLAVDRGDSELCASYIAAASRRFESVGFGQFFGSHAEDTDREAENEALWLAGRAFVTGRHHVSHCRWRLAEMCLRGGCSIYRSLLSKDHAPSVSESCVEKAKLGAVSCAILFALSTFNVRDNGIAADRHDTTRNISDETIADVAKEVSDLLGMASSLNTSISPATDVDAWKTRTRFIYMLSIEARTRVHDTAELMRVVRSCRADKVFTGADFHSVGHRLMTEKTIPMMEIAHEALSFAVQLLDAERESKLLLSAFRNLITSAEALSRDSLRSYSDVAGILDGKRLPEEAQDECYWLASSCWNKGRELAKDNSRALALEWLKTALKLAKHSPDIAGDVADMAASLQLLEDNIHGDADNAD